MMAQQIVNGLMLGGVYVMVAVAFTLAIGVLNFLNFSIPGIFMVAGMVSWAALKSGQHWLLAFGFALMASAIVGVAVYFLTYRPSSDSDPEVPLVSSLGFLVLLENLIILWLGSDQQSYPAIIADFNFRAGSIIVGGAQLLSLALSLAFVIALSLSLRFTNLGRQVRAIAESRRTASILGVNVGSVVPRVFVLSALFTGAGGILFAISYLQVSSSMGESIGFKGISAMIIGGMGNIWGAVAGGLLIGLVEILSTQFLGADFVNIGVYGLLLALLIIKPEGLFGMAVAGEKL
ncbi:branched-chain amino acid ABC transporter permease [Bradyrhizobium japonicum]|uniref:branched-chain amino acid ABC transporter permease n=1 Tax=Bradyrhizobium japonicum TaxID=375 RepID=UPI001BAA132F|nr:branched-chain amino acid ABC transporter permease [Bradyrhizobium japonicum]MBR0916209.1 branched-chain amino acid ABC transporter permease [Bradyrhizobium japonicum]